ncbi:MAG: hypothetical protein P9F19_18920 [Candidatus Contendobacter sp.]|nr:hypothetical protein [Candidatus Contendobacter sp.]MDG4559442.1 hypothetical protein [Candidatus Contendobacter sp.]
MAIESSKKFGGHPLWPKAVVLLQQAEFTWDYRKKVLANRPRQRAKCRHLLPAQHFLQF